MESNPKPNAFDKMRKEYTNFNMEKNITDTTQFWKLEDEILIYNPFNINKSEYTHHLLSFDLDGTPIGTNSGKTFANNENDWKLLFENVPDVIFNDISNRDKTALVIFSNQSGLSSKSLNIDMFKRKIERIIQKLNSNHKLEFLCLFSAEKGFFRENHRLECFNMLLTNIFLT